jgi:fibronectin-binding autotransporter adhesin
MNLGRSRKIARGLSQTRSAMRRHGVPDPIPISPRSPCFGRLSLAVAAAGVCFVGLDAQSRGAAQAWKNIGTDFNTAGNWNSALPSGNNVAAFNTSESAQPNLSASLSTAGFLFNTSSAYGYDITNSGGAAFTLTGYGSSATATSNSGAAAIYSAGTGTNTFDVNLILAPGSGTSSSIYETGSGGSLVLNGVISGLSTSLTFNAIGGSTISLNGANTFGGGATIATLSGGTGNSIYNLGNDSAFGTGTLTLGSSSSTLVASNSARNLANAVSLSASPTIGGTNNFTFSGAFALTSGHTLTVTNTALTTLAGSVNLGPASSSTAATLTIGGTGAVLVSGSIANLSTKRVCYIEF